MSIPIENVYYLLCYAWDALEQLDAVNVGLLESRQPADLLASVLVRGTNDLLRRGLDRDYLEFSTDVSGVRGRIDFAASTSRLLLPLARTHCRLDELSHDVLHNRILRATIRQLAAAIELAPENRGALDELWHRMPDVSPIRLHESLFDRVRLHRNNAAYGFLLQVCRLVHRSVLMDETGDRGRFVDFTRDESMALLFEAFVRNFYRRELADCRVGRGVVAWDATALDEHSASVLPRMELDTMLESRNATAVIETKFYLEPLQQRFNRPTVRPGHLYQLFAYLKNLELRGGSAATASGVLLYARSGHQLDYSYAVQGHRVWVTSVDLDKPWQDIHQEMLRIAESALALGRAS